MKWKTKVYFYRLAEVYETYRAERAGKSPTPPRRALTWLARQLMPNLGSVLLVLILLSVFPGLAAPFNGINATSVSTIPYQGRLADASGNPITGRQNMEFRLYATPTGGTPLWEEFWTGGNSVDVSDGLFSVMLGSINTGLTAVVQGNHNLYLGITVGTDTEMAPRVQLGSVPFSIWSLTVADNSITSAKIADGAVGSSEIAAYAVGSSAIATNAVTSDKLYRTWHKATLSANLPLPEAGSQPSALYDVLEITFDTTAETLITIHGSMGLSNLSAPAYFIGYLTVDGEMVSSGEINVAIPGRGESLVLSTALLLGPGQHHVVMQVRQLDATNSLVVYDTRTYLIVVEG